VLVYKLAGNFFHSFGYIIILIIISTITSRVYVQVPPL